MSGYRLSHTRTRTAQVNSSRSISLLSVVDSSPEPTTTTSGVVPGRALLDDQAPTAEGVSESEDSGRRYPRRPRFSTQAIEQYNEDLAKLKEKRKHRKARRDSLASAVSNQSTANDAPNSQPSEPGDAHDTMGGATARRPAGGNKADATVCQPRLQTGVVRRASAGQVPGIHGDDGTTSGVGHVEGGGDGPCSPSAAPDSTSQRDRDPARLAPDYWDFSADHELLERRLAHLEDADTDTLSQISPDNLKAIINEIVKDRRISRDRQIGDTQGPPQEAQDSQAWQVAEGPEVPNYSRQEGANHRRLPEEQAHTVQPPRLTTQAEPVANVSISVGGGHHLNQLRNFNRPGQSNNDINTDTETETETETEPEEHIIKPAILKHIIKSKVATQLSSPSPLPSAHRPIDSHTRSDLDLPSGNDPHQTLGKTRDPTQPSPSTGQTPRMTHHQDRSRAARALSALVLTPAPASRPPRTSPSRSWSNNQAGPSRPRGNTGQESSRAHRASKAATHAPEPLQPSTSRLPPAMAQAVSLARTRCRLRHERERRMRARATGESPAPSGSSAAPEPARLPSPPELLEDDQEERVAAEAEMLGRDPKRKRKPKPAARDVHGNERHILTIVKPHLFAYSVCEGAWQTHGLCASWVRPLWELTWEQEYPHLPVEAPSNRSIQCAVNALPTFRGKTKELLRPFVEYYFGFKKPAMTPDAIAHNVALTDKLLPNTFHCLAYDPPYGHYEGEALSLAIAVALFGTPTAVGVTFRGYFNPVPETAVAYVLANMQFAIEEWTTGKFQSRDLNASDMLNKYVAHLRGLKAARRRAKVRFKRLAQEWFDFGFEYSGAMELDDPFTQSVTQEDDIRPDTPTPDEVNEHDYLLTEPEEVGSESDDDRTRYAKRAKGKGGIFQVGDLGGALWSIAIAYHTFSLLFLLKKPSMWTTRIILGAGWTVTLVLPIVGPHVIQNVDKSGHFYAVLGAWCWIGPGYQLEWYLFLYMWVFLALVSSIVMYGLVYLRLSGRLSPENGKLVWKTSGQSRGLNCLTSSWAARDTTMSFHASEPGSNGGRTPHIADHNRLLYYSVPDTGTDVVGDAYTAYSVVTIPIVILRLGLTAGWKPPPAYPIFAGVAFSCSGLANVLLFIATRHSFIQQATGVRPRVHVSTQQVTVLEDAQGAQTVHLHELTNTTQPEDQDEASEKVDLEEGGSFRLKQRTPDAEEDVGTPTVGVRFLAKE